MKQWRIKVIGKQRSEIDRHLVVQAVLALGRQLKAKQAVREKKPGTPEVQA